MDRMFVVEVGYMPEKEEIEWLRKIWTENGKQDNWTEEIGKEIKLILDAGSSILVKAKEKNNY